MCFIIGNMDDSQGNHSVVVGTCPQMCSDREIRLRESRELIHWLESENGKRNKADRSRMVKEYARPAAGKSDPVPSDLRPGPVLLTTATYLIRRIVPLSKRPWHCIYDYVFDRMRAIRQDMTIQRITNSPGVHVLECALRVMIYAHYRLCEEPPANFVAKINATHIQECLKKLLNLYDRPRNCQCHMAEFLAYYLMFNLGSAQALQYGLDRKHKFSGDSVFSLALSVSLAWWKANYVRCFRLSRFLPVLHLCALHNHRHTLVRKSIAILCSGYNSRNLSVPLADVTRMLDLNDVEHTRSRCQACGLQVVDKCVKFVKTNLKHDVALSPEYHKLIEEDLAWEDLPDLLIGSPCMCTL